MSTIDWKADSWFVYHFADKLTEDFKAWWADFYGPPDQHPETPDKQDEYWVRCAFAWHGWNARNERK